MALVQANGDESQPKLSIPAQYVQALMALASYEGINAHRAAIPLHMPGNTGIHLHAKTGDDAAKKKLRAAIDKLVPQLPEVAGVDLGDHWTEDLAEYKAGLQELRALLMEQFEGKIEDQVFKKRLIVYELERVESGKNASKDHRRLERVNTNIKELLGIYYTWEVVGTPTSAKVVNDEVVQNICKGQFPWSTTASLGNGAESAQRYYGSQYRTAINQLKRTEEESEILKVEVVRFFNRLEELFVIVDGKMNEEMAISEEIAKEFLEVNDDGSRVESNLMPEDALRKYRLALGKQRLFQLEKDRLICIYNDAVERLKGHLPTGTTV